MMRPIVLLSGVLLLGGCDRDAAPSARADAVTAPKAAATSVGASAGATAATSSPPTPTSAPSAGATASASSTASAGAATAASAAAEPLTLLATIAKATKVKVRRLEPSGGGEAVVIDEAEKVAQLLEALGTSQTAVDACPRCIPSVQLTFEDAYGTRLGTVGLFCSDRTGQPELAALRDALANTCQTVTVAEPEKLRAVLSAALPTAADAG